MICFDFCIRGNHEDPDNGNPLGYHRTTQRGKWDPKARKYEAWKDYIWTSLLKANPDPPRFAPKQKVFIKCRIEYINDRRPDPGNVVKGIADALADKKVGGIVEQRLYQNDRYVAEQVTDFVFSKRPGVHVIVSGNI